MRRRALLTSLLVMLSSACAHAEPPAYSPASLLRTLVPTERQEHDARSEAADAFGTQRLEAENLVWGRGWRETVSELLATRHRDDLLSWALFAIETSDRATSAIPLWLDEGAPSGVVFDEAAADRLALELETVYPLLGARGAVLASVALQRDDPDTSRRLALAALAYAEASLSESAELYVTRGHALRLLGQHDEAIGQYERARRATDGRSGERIERSLPLEITLGALLSRVESGMDPLTALAFVDRLLAAEPASLDLALAVPVLDVAFELERRRGAPLEDVVARHDRAFREAMGDERQRTRWRALGPSLAAVGDRLGGIGAMDRLPVSIRLAKGLDVPRGADSIEWLRGAYLAAKLARADDPNVWVHSSHWFGVSAIGGADVRLSNEGVAVLLTLLEEVEEYPDVWAAYERLRGANRAGWLDAKSRERWYALLVARLPVLRDPEGGPVDVLGLALLEELERRVTPERALSLVDEANEVFASSGSPFAPYGALRVRGAALRALSPEHAGRAGLARETLALAKHIGTERDAAAEERSGAESSRPWDVYAADAMLVLGDAEAALAVLLPADSPERLDEHASRAYLGSIRRVRAHAQVMTGDVAGAATTLRGLLADPNPVFLLPGAPFTPDTDLADGLTRSFVGDEAPVTERLLLEARYALVRGRLGSGSRPETALGCARDTALLIRAGMPDEAIERLSACDDERSSRLRLLRGEALLRSGAEAQAFAVFRTLANGLSASAEMRATREHWHAWARMLEILERQNEDGSRSQAITDAVRRLRALPSWGEHAECVVRIEAVASRVAI